LPQDGFREKHLSFTDIRNHEFIMFTDEINAKVAPQRAGAGTEVSYEQLN